MVITLLDSIALRDFLSGFAGTTCNLFAYLYRADSNCADDAYLLRYFFCSSAIRLYGRLEELADFLLLLPFAFSCVA